MSNITFWKITDENLNAVGIGDRIYSGEEAEDILGNKPIVVRNIEYPIQLNKVHLQSVDFSHNSLRYKDGKIYQSYNNIFNELQLLGAIHNFYFHQSEESTDLQSTIQLPLQPPKHKLYLYKFTSKLVLYNIVDLLVKATEDGFLEIVKYVIEHENVRTETKNHIFMIAIDNDQLDIVKYFVDIVDHITINDGLEAASLKGNNEIVEYLLDDSADVHFNDDSSLRGAVDTGNTSTVKLLVEYGADITVNDYEPVTNAVEKGYFEIVEFLIENVNNDDKEDVVRRALEIAEDNNSAESHLQIIEYLRSIFQNS